MDRTKLREDVARAICCPSGKCRNAPSGGPIATNADVIGCLSIMHSQAADAAISAVLAGIREPSEGMIDVGDAEIWEFSPLYADVLTGGKETAVATWQAMIDHLIQENGKEAKSE